MTEKNCRLVEKPAGGRRSRGVLWREAKKRRAARRDLTLTDRARDRAPFEPNRSSKSGPLDKCFLCSNLGKLRMTCDASALKLRDRASLPPAVAYLH